MRSEIKRRQFSEIINLGFPMIMLVGQKITMVGER